MKRRKRSSCLKRMLLGCGTMIGFMILISVLLTLTAKINQREDADYTSIQTAEEFVTEGLNEQRNLSLPDSPEKTKPVKVVLDVEMAQFRIRPHTKLGKIEVDADYDQANFELKTETEDKGDYILYRLTFESKRGFLGLLMPPEGEKGGLRLEELENRVTLRLPPDLLLDLDVKGKMGQMTWDLSGLAVSSLEAKFSMGELEMEMAEPNQVEMKKLDVKASMGETRVKDLQNFRASEAEFKGSMGELNVEVSAAPLKDMEISMRTSMGEGRLALPEDIRLEKNIRVAMGDSSASFVPTNASDAPLIKVKGRASMGEFAIRPYRAISPLRRWGNPVGNTKPRPTQPLFEALNKGGSAEIISTYKTLKTRQPEAYNFDPEVLNDLGYTLLDQGKTADAKALFAFLVQEFPEYANGFDSYGDALTKAGENRLAVQQYRKALELDPGRDQTQAKLERIQ